MSGEVFVNFPFIIVALLLAIGFYTIGFKKNLIKVVIGIEILEGAVNLFLVALGYVKGGYAPIYTLAPPEAAAPQNMVLPTPQALTLTSIVIGVAVSALMLAFAVNIYKQYGTLDVTKIRRLRG